MVNSFLVCTNYPNTRLDPELLAIHRAVEFYSSVDGGNMHVMDDMHRMQPQKPPLLLKTDPVEWYPHEHDSPLGPLYNNFHVCGHIRDCSPFHDIEWRNYTYKQKVQALLLFRVVSKL